MKEKETEAAQYALGVLAPNERDRVALSAGNDRSLRKTIANWEMELSRFSEVVEPSVPPHRVWNAIDRRIGRKNTALPVGVEAVPHDQGEWWQLDEGVDVKSLFIDDEQDTESFLLRIMPGCRVEQHQHDGFHDECIVVEGDIIVGDVQFGPGDFHVATSGSVHPPLSSEHGGILYVRSKRITFPQSSVL